MGYSPTLLWHHSHTKEAFLAVIMFLDYNEKSCVVMQSTLHFKKSGSLRGQPWGWEVRGQGEHVTLTTQKGSRKQNSELGILHWKTASPDLKGAKKTKTPQKPAEKVDSEHGRVTGH